MPEVTVEVGGRAYRLGCAEGEEAHLRAMAARLDAETRKLAAPGAQEGRLLVMAALILADRLHEAEAELARVERRLVEARRAAEAQAAGDLFGPEREAALAQRILALAARLDALAQRD